MLDGLKLIKFKTSAVISPTTRHLLPLCFSLCGGRIGWFSCPGGLCGAALFTQDAWLQFSLQEFVIADAKSETKYLKKSGILLSEKEASKEKAKPLILSHLAAIDLEPFFSLSCLFYVVSLLYVHSVNMNFTQPKTECYWIAEIQKCGCSFFIVKEKMFPSIKLPLYSLL